MLKFTATKGDGGKIVGLGLTRANIERMMAGQPVLVHARDLNLPYDLDITLIFGEDEAAIEKMLRDGGMIGPNTKKHTEPRRKP